MRRFTVYRPHIASFPTPVLRATIRRQRLGLLVQVVDVPLVVVDLGPVPVHRCFRADWEECEEILPVVGNLTT